MILTFIDLNSVEINYYPCRISLDKCCGRCNAAADVSMKICVSSKTKDVNIKLWNLVAKKIESKTLVNHISCNCKFKFNSTTGSICETCTCVWAPVFVRIVSI